MSRIHEALKKAEQERSPKDSIQQVETAPIIAESAAAPGHSSAAVSAMSVAGTAAVMTPDSLLARGRRTQWHPDPKTMLFFNDEEQFTGMEEFRILRSRLYQVRDKQPLSTLLVSSALPKEGKSFVAANLAQVIVRQHGRRALLIDADLRNSQLHLLLGADRGPGLSEYLRGAADEFSVLQYGSMENLFLIPAGAQNDNPAELLSSGRLKVLLNRLAPLFDWVIVDSPPALGISDAGLLANSCDGVLMVVRSNATPFDLAKKAQQEFSDHPLIGVVLNGIDSLPSYTQYYYSAYGKPNGKEKA
jgi:capsular exopolysaccharide synthesis family protein